MNKYDFYDEFIKANKIRLKEIFIEIHSLYEERSTIYSKVSLYKELLIQIGFNFDSFTKMLYEDDYYINILHNKSRRYIPEDIAKDIVRFLTIHRSISKLKHELKIVAFLCKTPQRMYFMMQYNFNREIANFILKGGVYNFGQHLSRLGISYVLRGKNSKPVVDWGESNKLKKQLIEQGFTPKSQENPNGIKWILHRTDEGYCFWKWLKSRAFIPNKKMYKFRAIATNNECTDYGGTLTQEEILAKSIGPFDKMMALLKLNPQIKERYDF